MIWSNWEVNLTWKVKESIYKKESNILSKMVILFYIDSMSEKGNDYLKLCKFVIYYKTIMIFCKMNKSVCIYSNL